MRAIRSGRAASRLVLIVPVALGVAACGLGARPEVAAIAPSVTPPMPMPPPTLAGPVLGSDGRCQGQAPVIATAIAPGIGECELVRLKGSAPTDVLVGEGGKGAREVQVLYSEPTGRELYFFVDNRLDRIVR